MHTPYVKRTIFISTCPVCGNRVERADNDSRIKERQCVCGKWVPYEAVSWIGPACKRAFVSKPTQHP